MKNYSLADLAQVICKENGKKVAYGHGVFDLLHPGYLQHFQSANQSGQIGCVTIRPDKYVDKEPGRPVFNQRLRARYLAALEIVNYVKINESPSAVETIYLLLT